MPGLCGALSARHGRRIAEREMSNTASLLDVIRTTIYRTLERSAEAQYAQ